MLATFVDLWFCMVRMSSDSNPDGKGKWNAFKFLLVASSCLLLLFILGVLGLFLPARLWIHRSNALLKTPGIYEPVGRRLALYCQSDPTNFPEFLSYAWLPATLQPLGNGWGQVTPDQANIELGGGFYHFGYSLKRNPRSSTALSNVYDLSAYSEEHDETFLKSFVLAKTNRLESAEVLALVIQRFDQQISQQPRDSAARLGKTLLQLRFGQQEPALKSCKAWMDADPGYWLPQLTYAHLRSRLGQTDAAAAELEAWTHAHDNFAHEIYLALFTFGRIGRRQA
jgi:hypothetical protein